MTTHAKDNCAQHHALLLDYANGTLDPASSLVVAAWLTLSPPARAVVRDCEALGGALLESLCDPCAIDADSLDSVLARIDREACKSPCADKAESANCAIACAHPLPRPLAHLFPDCRKPAWKRGPGGLRWIHVHVPGSHAIVQLIQAPPALAIPEHRHDGVEITLILEGALEDRTGRYTRGDLVLMDDDTHHKPVADRDQGCLCFSVNTRPLRFTGPLMRFLNPFMRG